MPMRVLARRSAARRGLARHPGLGGSRRMRLPGRLLRWGNERRRADLPHFREPVATGIDDVQARGGGHETLETRAAGVRAPILLLLAAADDVDRAAVAARDEALE